MPLPKLNGFGVVVLPLSPSRFFDVDIGFGEDDGSGADDEGRKREDDGADDDKGVDGLEAEADAGK